MAGLSCSLALRLGFWPGPGDGAPLSLGATAQLGAVGALSAVVAWCFGGLVPLALVAGVVLLAVDAGPQCVCALAMRLLAPCTIRDVAKPCRAATERFEVCAPVSGDVAELTALFESDYVCCHRKLYGSVAGGADQAEWRAALGHIDFQTVVEETTSSKGRGDVRLLKCVQRGAGATQDRVAGYILYELRKKGPPRHRKQHCELVNIVVREDLRGCGAGRQLFEALCSDLEGSAQGHANDLRLYVASSNVGPLSWYKRLGFHPSGWQSEKVGGAEIRFMRMARHQAAVS